MVGFIFRLRPSSLVYGLAFVHHWRFASLIILLQIQCQLLINYYQWSVIFLTVIVGKAAYGSLFAHY